MSQEFATEFTTMLMLQDKDGKVLVQERVLYWKGIAFPGGHINPGEELIRCATREFYEETGLHVENPTLCGIVHWDNTVKREKYMVFLYKADRYTGTLLDSTEEGRVFWMTPEELKSAPLSPNFENYLDIFFGNQVKEWFGTYS